jgi:hypothetical protein
LRSAIQERDFSSLAASIRRLRGDILSTLPGHPAHFARRSEVGRLVVIVAASRSGSSLLFEILKQSPQLLSMDGEHTPYYKINVPEWTDGNAASDRFEPGRITDESLDGLFRDMALELGVGGERKEQALDGYPAFVALRLALQWPDLNQSNDEWLGHIGKALAEYRAASREWDTLAFFKHVMRRLRARFDPVNPAFYDVPGAPWPDPNGDDKLLERTAFLEEPPFVVVRPRRRPGAEEVRSQPLLLKSSLDAYRLPVLRKLFPRAEICVIRLTRNPAASINGLYDGWRSRGFFSHKVGPGTVLRIPGYSEIAPWAEDWWKFDLPPGWESYARCPLERVCGFQWAAANKAIIEDLRLADRSLSIRFESLLEGPAKRLDVLRTIAEFAEVRLDRFIAAASENMPVVMATRPPRPGRWKERRALIRPVIAESGVGDVSAELGYGREEIETWP